MGGRGLHSAQTEPLKNSVSTYPWSTPTAWVGEGTSKQKTRDNANLCSIVPSDSSGVHSTCAGSAERTEGLSASGISR
jgi:hypothetical protein